MARDTREISIWLLGRIEYYLTEMTKELSGLPYEKCSSEANLRGILSQTDLLPEEIDSLLFFQKAVAQNLSEEGKLLFSDNSIKATIYICPVHGPQCGFKKTDR